MPDATGGREFDAIGRIAARMAAAPPGELWIGDDAALVRLGDATVVVAADALAAGVHADLSLTSIADLGWKALAVNISDLAAMGCVATRALVTVAGPPDTDLDGLYDGITAASDEFGCVVVGGDLTSAPSLVVSVTVLGNGAVIPPPVTRHSARPGDHVWVTGALGAAGAGLRALRQGCSAPELVRAHARPIPRIREGTAARELGATAMIDVSDGFAADLGHILDASGVGVDLESVPVAEGANTDDALSGGDDYELVWCCAPGLDIAAAFAARGLRPPARVGVVVADRGRRVIDGRPLASRGWTHDIG